MRAKNDKMKKEECRQAIESVINKLREQSGRAAMETLYATLPFYMECQTKYEKKEKYNDIVKQLEEAEKAISSGKLSQKDTLWYLMTLIDVIDNMSVEIYEQYRKLQDIFKRILKEVLQETDNCSGLSASEKTMTAYCVLKACNMGIVLKEKYADCGMEIMESVLKEESGDSGDAKEMRILFQAYVQYVKLEKEME